MTHFSLTISILLIKHPLWGRTFYKRAHNTFIRLIPYNYFSQNLILHSKNFYINWLYYQYSSYSSIKKITKDKNYSNLPYDKWRNICAKFYENAKLDRSKISTDNKDKSGIYL